MKSRKKTFNKFVDRATLSSKERVELMRAYLVRTRPSFEEAVKKSMLLNTAANGVLAGTLQPQNPK